MGPHSKAETENGFCLFGRAKTADTRTSILHGLFIPLPEKHTSWEAHALN